MQLKDFQQRVINDIEQYLDAVARERAAGNERFASMAAWESLRLPGTYHRRTNGLGEDMPTFTIKVPTGGGKTVIATQVLGSIYRTILEGRRGAGLVLWVVPSSQIYRDTVKRLSDRDDWYRMMLEHAVSRRIEVWEKTDIARLTPAKLAECLNILIVQLASTNRETAEQLKFFRDSGGNIVQHFPPEDDPDAHRRLNEQFPNLDMIDDDLVTTSIGNLVRICRPPVIVDEGHKATSRLARQRIESFNASVVVELSATPKGMRSNGFVYEPNVICRVTGEELLREEMIKLPLNIGTSAAADWRDVLTRARDKREALQAKANECAAPQEGEGRIRPIVLVQVERTGKEQRGPDHIHSEDVREYLVSRLGADKNAVAVKSAELDELSDVDNLLDPDCPIEWIITKSALQEGWDCPFAYILVSLDNTGSETAMTQLIGRILRQPYQRRLPREELNESYVYCLRTTAAQIARQVKGALEKEGYEGDTDALIVDAADADARPTSRRVRIREEFSNLYTRPFEGKIYLPRFCVKTDAIYEALDWFTHLLNRVDEVSFEYAGIDWPLEQELREAKDRFYRMTLGDAGPQRKYEVEAEILESDQQVLAWMTASLPFDYLSHKQLRRIVRRVYDRLCECELSGMVKDRIGLVKFVVRDKIVAFINEQIERQTERAFVELFDSGRLQFYLECAQCRFPVPPEITIRATRQLVNHQNEPVKSSLFDYVDEADFNEYEKAVAIFMDDHPEVLWWYRNLIGEENFSIQGYRRERIRPDFVVQSKYEHRPLHHVLVLESKGKHLEGNPDTTYKKKVADYFEKVGKRVTWQQLGEDFKDHVFRFQVLDEMQELGRDWKDELQDVLRNST